MKRAFWALTAFVVVSFLAMGLTLDHLGHAYMSMASERRVKDDLEMLATITQGALAQRDYERIEEQVLLWGETDPNVVALRLAFEGEKPLVEFTRDIQTDRIYRVEHLTSLPSVRRVRFDIEYDMAEITESVHAISVPFFAIAGFVGFAFVLSVWQILQRPAIRPLQKEIAWRELAQKALAESESRFRGLVESSCDWIWEVDENCVCTYASPKVEDILGYKPEEVVGKTPFDLMLPEEVERVGDIFRDAVARGQSLTAIENTNLHKDDGRHVVLETSGVPILREDGTVSGCRGIDRDITDRKSAEKKLWESEIRYRELSDNMGSGVAVYEAVDDGCDFVFKDFNSAAQRIECVTKDEVVGKRVTAAFPGVREFGILEVFQRVWRTGAPERVPVAFYQDEKVTGWRENYVYKLPSGELVAVYDDVTERKQAEDDLRIQRYYLARAQEIGNIGTWELDITKNELIWTDENYRIFGLPLGTELTYESFLNSVLPDDRQYVDRQWKAALDGKPYDIEHRLLVGGETRWVREKAELEFDEEGTCVRGTGFAQDITDRKRAEQERERLIAKLEAQNAELERFAYTVSHDLKSPLITINGYVGMLRKDLAEGNSGLVENDLARISNAADKMDRLLKDLLELSRIGRMVNLPEDVPLEELANEALQLLGGQIGQRNVEVEISRDLPVVFGDRLRLLEVLQNLIDNAVKYMGDQPHPRVEIAARPDDHKTVICVRDNGIGIEPRYYERIFGLFDQLDQNVEGSGIGLALVKRIVEVHDGRIWVESAGLGHGSTFCFTIPLKDS